MSPSLSSRLSLLLRSERYRCLDIHPLIRTRTDFFAAACTVTRVLAYGGATPFLLALSDALERVNVSRARLICGGRLYSTGSVERNTLDFVRYEQILVQQWLERLRSSHPGEYSQQIRFANSAIAHALGRRAACASGTLAIFVRAGESCLARLGRAIEFSAQEDREMLGVELARSARAGHRSRCRPHGPAVGLIRPDAAPPA